MSSDPNRQNLEPQRTWKNLRMAAVEKVEEFWGFYYRRLDLDQQRKIQICKVSEQ